MTSSSLAGRRLPPPGAVLGALVIWLGLAVLAGTTGFLVRLPFPGPQVLFATLFVAALASALWVPAVRDWVDALPLRALIGINATRFIGITFLVLAARGEIAPVFANRAGWGDIATATLAIMLFLAGDPRTARQRALVHVWNVFGFLDLVVAVGTATWVTLNGIIPGVRPVLGWPLSVVPLFFVPLFLASHVLIARRLFVR